MTQTRKTNPILYVAASALLLASSITTADASEAFMAAQAATIKTPNSSLTLDISGFDSREGQVMIALFDSEDDYEAETPLKGETVQVDKDTVRVTFNKLRMGEYAFKLFHDANGNGELDTDALGIPSEDYYFSNDASDPFSAPEWDEAKFRLPHGRVTKTIDID
jgi:uncharacterized protein (DUF2141 family)